MQEVVLPAPVLQVGGTPSLDCLTIVGDESHNRFIIGELNDDMGWHLEVYREYNKMHPGLRFGRDEGVKWSTLNPSSVGGYRKLSDTMTSRHLSFCCCRQQVCSSWNCHSNTHPFIYQIPVLILCPFEFSLFCFCSFCSRTFTFILYRVVWSRADNRNTAEEKLQCVYFTSSIYWCMSLTCHPATGDRGTELSSFVWVIKPHEIPILSCWGQKCHRLKSETDQTILPFWFVLLPQLCFRSLCSVNYQGIY